MTSRRRFLQLAAGMGLALGGCRPRSQDSAAAAPRVEIPPNRVVIARNPAAVSGGKIEAAAVDALLDKALAQFGPSGDGGAVLKALFRPSDVVAVKVSCLPGPPLSSHPELVVALAKRLREAIGIDASNIIVYDKTFAELEVVGFKAEADSYRALGNDQAGYDEEPTVSGEAGSCYSRVISETATAILNVPLLKDHDLAGLSGALKNHFGSIHNPNKMHTNHCCPYVADVNCAPHIRDKQRLIVYDALLVCYDGGPSYKPDTTVAYGAIMVATDPVAADAVGFDLIEKLRAQHGLPPIAGSERAPKYLQVAADPAHQLGVADLKSIDVREVT